MSLRSITFAMLFLFCGNIAASCIDPQFVEVQHRYPLTFPPNGIVTGDFNGDGLPDIAVFGETSIDVLRNLGGLQFSTPVALPVVGTKFSGIVAVDFNHDGKMDLIAADSGASALWFLEGNGDMTFNTTQLSIGMAPQAIAVGDFEENGQTDIAVIANDAHVLAIFRGGPTGLVLVSQNPIAANAESLVEADLDNDGHLDIAVSHQNSTSIDLFFGKGDGTFDTPVEITGGNWAYKLAAADVNRDGYNDLLGANWTDHSLTVNLNSGGRSFLAPVAYSTLISGALMVTPTDVVVRDFTGDGIPDAVVVNGAAGYLSVFHGRGDGTFDSPYAVPLYGDYVNPVPWAAATADFDGDGRDDIVLAKRGPWEVSIVQNHCGDSSLFLTTQTPVVSVNQSFSVQYALDGVAYQAPGPSGTISIHEGSTVLAVAAANAGCCSPAVTVGGLPAGDHSLYAVYSGDANYNPNTSNSIVVHVTTATTTTEVTVFPSSPVYGQAEFVTTVTSSTGDQPTGTVLYTIDGQQQPYGDPIGSMTSVLLDPGQHTISGSYSGDTTDPPSTSTPFAFAIAKATPTIQLGVNAGVLTAGATTTVSGQFLSPHGGLMMSGNLSVMEGSQIVATVPATTTFTLTVSGLTMGTHVLFVSYPGDTRYNAVTSTSWTVDVIPNQPIQLRAIAGSSSITLTWTDLPTTAPHNFFYYRTIPGVPFGGPQAGVPGTTATDYPSPANQTYLYRVSAFDSQTNALVVSSNVDSAMMTTFTDDPLVAGTTVVKAVHIQEIETAVNQFRVAAGLTPISTGVDVGTVITASQIVALRNAINEARAAVSVAPFVFADPTLAAGDLIKAIHVQQLRDALR